jgi:energy-coupling factor transport system permease protein
MIQIRHDRPVHPGAWWAWAACLAVTASRTLNLLLLGSIVGVTMVVVHQCRIPSPVSRVYRMFLQLAVFVILTRVVLELIFAPRLPGNVLFTLPEAQLPEWMAGVSVGGAVTTEMFVHAIAQGSRLAVLMITFGAVNALASPSRLLRSLPAVLYEAGVTSTVALTAAPQAVLSAQQVMSARRLRGRPTRGVAGLRGVAVPVLDLAVDRAVELAASMDARGYGRTVHDTSSQVRTRGIMLAAGFIALAVGLYGLLGSGGESTWALWLVVAGTVGVALTIVLASRHDPRSRHRALAWDLRAWGVVVCGLALVVALVVTAVVSPGALDPFDSAGGHRLPLTMVPGLLLAMGPAWFAPTPRDLD